ncbi:carboxylating nicotinate-nucleotide diphosphorylase [Owenweeksia hongkongensis]|uniref:carboxylating nicotinate-nucleotide diphosphorylase n=1 Tax=Owenweeksia hongkongensis TaxID=253245 RepID=UPI003A8DF4EC
MISKDYLDRFIDHAIAEDIGPGDHSSNCSIPANAEGKMYLLVKEEGIIAGIDVAKRVFEKVDPAIKMEILMKDGDAVKPGDIAFRLQGPERALLRSERLALNIMQRMSGIATRTHHIVKLIQGTSTKLLDTRKTTPNMRALEKYAVTVGGGYNHRMGLYDMIMLKDNHVDFAGGITNAIDKAHEYIKENGLDIGIEVETRNLEELQQVIDKGGVQRVMFDNYSIEDTIKALKMVDGKFETESSGGITETTIRSYAETGVDFISVGALTHSVKSLDLSLKAE